MLAKLCQCGGFGGWCERSGHNGDHSEGGLAGQSAKGGGRVRIWEIDQFLTRHQAMWPQSSPSDLHLLFGIRLPEACSTCLLSWQHSTASLSPPVQDRIVLIESHSFSKETVPVPIAYLQSLQLYNLN